MHHRGPAAAGGHRSRPRQERSLIVDFIGSFPAADFRLQPALPEIAFLGRSNVGKSSLLNALVGRRTIARTSRSPGKTRLCNVYRVDGRYYLVDLPGYGYARVSKDERARFLTVIGDYLSDRRTLAGVVWLVDVRRDPSPDDMAAAQRVAQRGVPVLLAVTKADKLPRARRTERVHAILAATELPEDQCVVTSAQTREGIEALRKAIARLVGRPGGRKVRPS